MIFDVGTTCSFVGISNVSKAPTTSITGTIKRVRLYTKGGQWHWGRRCKTGVIFKEGLENVTLKEGLLGAISKKVFIWARDSSELRIIEVFPLSFEMVFQNFICSNSENGDSRFYLNASNDL
jgi:hypothetical protein